ncbi:uncharacterized protein LOC130653701 [Hydractinia symbiolongicarpus]|uniref:uncharacterized protein LOC130653701 n=1 Tax=Hydractinia symbiolongicarpus TaxID=13093 RepID=UPI002550F4B0|nr:uncharacterized protein LOC130653701 [Hydractinia symbiolongicarpus]
MKELRNLKNNCSTGPDAISVRFLKQVAEFICSPLTQILNEFIHFNEFPLHKKIVLKQLIEFIESTNIYKDTVDGFRKGCSTSTALMELKDDIKKAMKANEVTLMVLIDFSKAFDTIRHNKLIKKMASQDNSLCKLIAIIQINYHHYSEYRKVLNLGPILFNLYVNDLQDAFDASTIQYADDTTIYRSCKPANIVNTEISINDTLNELDKWAEENFLAANAAKTKFVLISTKHLSNS